MLGRWNVPIGEKSCLVLEEYTNKMDSVDGKARH